MFGSIKKVALASLIVMYGGLIVGCSEQAKDEDENKSGSSSSGGNTGSSGGSGSGSGLNGNTTGVQNNTNTNVLEFRRGSNWAIVMPKNIANQTTYQEPNVPGRKWYVDSVAGNDTTGTGTLQNPLKTLGEMAKKTLGSGDAVLLKCGSLFRESWNLTTSKAANGNVLIGGYGDCTNGKRPVISGADDLGLGGWTRFQSTNIYEKVSQTVPKSMWINGVKLNKARHPNDGGIGAQFNLARSNGSAKNSFFVSVSDQALMSDKDLVGAEVHVRTVNWMTESAVVQAYDSATGLVTLDRSLEYPIDDVNGYIFEGKPWMLDGPNEWTYDSASGKIGVWQKDSATPAQWQSVEMGVRDYGFKVTWADDMIVEWLETQKNELAGVEISESDRTSVRGILSQYDGKFGISMLVSNNFTVENSRVIGAGEKGISTREGTNVTVRNNWVSDTGMIARAPSGVAGIALLSGQGLVTGNKVENSANTGIHFRNGAGTVIEKNTVIKPCVRLTDCGGIYTWTGTSPTLPATAPSVNGTVRNNVVADMVSNQEGIGPIGKNMGVGIFLDELSSGITITQNVVLDSEVGINFHDANYNTASNNVIRGVKSSGVRGFGSRTDVPAIKGNVVESNSIGYASPLAMLPGDRESTGLEEMYAQYWFHPNDVNGLFAGPDRNRSQNNTVVGVHAKDIYKWRMGQNGQNTLLTKAQWDQKASGEIITKPILYKSFNTIEESNLITNGNFSGTAPWTFYSDPMGSGASLTSSSSGCVTQSTCGLWVSGSSGDTLQSNEFTLNSTSGNNLYRVSFTAKGGIGGGNLRSGIRLNASPFTNYGYFIASTPLANGESVQADQFFRATGGANAVLDFKGAVNGQTFLENVKVRRVTNITYPDFKALIRTVYNAQTESVQIECADLQISSCNAVNDGGNPVSFPITLAPNQQVTVYVQDAQWQDQ